MFMVGCVGNRSWIWRPYVRRMSSQRQAGQVRGVERQCRTMSLLGVSKESLPLMKLLH